MIRPACETLGLFALGALLIALAGCGGEAFDTGEPFDTFDVCAVEGVEDCAPDCTPPICDLESANLDGWNTGHAEGFANGQAAVVCAPTRCDCGAVGGDFGGNFATCALLPANTSGDPPACLALCIFRFEGAGEFLTDCRTLDGWVS